MKRFCNTEPCNCVLSDWGTCSKSCAGGAQFKAIIQHPTAGGTACPPLSERTRSCNTQACAPEDCELSGWGECDCSTKKQERTILGQAQFNGKSCAQVQGSEGLSKDCTDWLAHAQKLIVLWAGTNATAVVKTQSRKSNNKPKNGGKTCDTVKVKMA